GSTLSLRMAIGQRWLQGKTKQHLRNTLLVMAAASRNKAPCFDETLSCDRNPPDLGLNPPENEVSAARRMT
ncbi:MAG TPA: hypothetical protein VNY06_01030, partial [Methylocella sp.]|nr:hypothetical protein [Methylocella sp.]